MGKTSRWLRKFLTGKRDKQDKEKDSKYNNNGYDHTPAISIQQLTTPKEKRRWSFRRSSAAATPEQDVGSLDRAVDHLVDTGSKGPAAECVRASTVDEVAAVKIQSFFRAYLARKALNALKGVVKLQALVRGHLVRKQATATLRCMQALVTVQARALAHRMRMAEEIKRIDHTPLYYNHRKSTHDRCAQEDIKIVEMDLGDYKHVTKARNSYSNHTQPDRTTEHNRISPSPSAMTDISPRTCSSHFEEYSLGTAQSSPQCHSTQSKPNPERILFSYPRSDYAESLYSEYPFHPNYMANTESSRAKARCHSAPKQRPIETFDRLPCRRKTSIEGRNVPRAVRMQRSSSHVGLTGAQYPWSVKLDRSSVSVKDSECGSSSTVITNMNYSHSVLGFEVCQ